MPPSPPVNQIAAAYDQWSQTYETAPNATRDLAAFVLRQELKIARDRDVLEIGCGTGLNTRFLAERHRSVFALDFSEGMLAQARVKVSAPNVRFEQGDIRQRLNAPEASVDLVVCTLVLEHVEALDPVFREAARVLRPGGEFFGCELHPFRQLQGGQAQFTDKASGDTVLVPAFIHDVSDYLNASAAHGFELVRLGEWRDAAAKLSCPRLLSLHSRLRQAATI